MRAELLQKRDDAEDDLKKRLDRSQPKTSTPGEDNPLNDDMRKEKILDNIIASASEDLLKERLKQLCNGALFMSACLFDHGSALEDKAQTAQKQLLSAQREVVAANQEVDKIQGEIDAKKKLEKLMDLQTQAAQVKRELEGWWTNYCQYGHCTILT